MATSTTTTTEPDMVNLPELSVESVLSNLASRYESDHLYTYIASLLVSVNPYKSLPHLYDRGTLAKYRRLRHRGQQPPHVFAIADAAYHDLVNNLVDQSILVSGESGSGKTEVTKFLLRFITSIHQGIDAADAGADHRVEKRILQANPLLESFGNAKTIRNNNSSRFGKFIKLWVRREGVTGGTIEHYLLEKTRVCHQAPFERNYHVFYQLLAGAEPGLLSKLGLVADVQQYNYVNQCVENLNDEKGFQRLIEAMDTFDIQQQERMSVFAVLAAILHLGQLQFQRQPHDISSEAGKPTHPLTVTNKQSLAKAASLLGIREEKLLNSLVTRKVQSANRQSVYTVVLNQQEAKDGLDSFAKAIYSRLFDWLVNRINSKIEEEENELAATNFLAVLDIFGFEVFDCNSFEQLAINYANEQLHQLYINFVCKQEQEEYVKEEIDWDPVQFEDNLSCLNLIEERGGILSLLNEECIMPRGTDLTWFHKLATVHEKHPRLSLPKHTGMATMRRKAQKDNFSFTVHHFAGAVEYQIDGFLDKNRDSFSNDLYILMETSSIPFVKSFFIKKINEESDLSNLRRSRAQARIMSEKKTNKNKHPTASSTFKKQLLALNETIKQTNTHYIRCIKPNENQKPNEFNKESIEKQLIYLGLLDTIKIRKEGFGLRCLFSDFISMFQLVLNFFVDKKKQELEIEREKESGNVFPSSSFVSFFCNEINLDENDYKIGKTRIFLKDKAAQKINDLKEQSIEKFAQLIQSNIFSFIARKKYHIDLQCIHERKRKEKEEKERKEKEEKERKERKEKEDMERREKEEKERREKEEKERMEKEEKERREKEEHENQLQLEQQKELEMKENNNKPKRRAPPVIPTKEKEDDKEKEKEKEIKQEEEGGHYSGIPKGIVIKDPEEEEAKMKKEALSLMKTKPSRRLPVPLSEIKPTVVRTLSQPQGQQKEIKKEGEREIEMTIEDPPPPRRKAPMSNRSLKLTTEEQQQEQQQQHIETKSTKEQNFQNNQAMIMKRQRGNTEKRIAEVGLFVSRKLRRAGGSKEKPTERVNVCFYETNIQREKQTKKEEIKDVTLYLFDDILLFGQTNKSLTKNENDFSSKNLTSARTVTLAQARLTNISDPEEQKIKSLLQQSILPFEFSIEHPKPGDSSGKIIEVIVFSMNARVVKDAWVRDVKAQIKIFQALEARRQLELARAKKEKEKSKGSIISRTMTKRVIGKIKGKKNKETATNESSSKETNINNPLIPGTWRRVFQRAGVTDEHLNDPQSATLILGAISEWSEKRTKIAVPESQPLPMTDKLCVACGFEFPKSNLKFCIECGHRSGSCPSCKVEIGVNEVNCLNCGQTLLGRVASETTGPSVSIGPAPVSAGRASALPPATAAIEATAAGTSSLGVPSGGEEQRSIRVPADMDVDDDVDFGDSTAAAIVVDQSAPVPTVQPVVKPRRPAPVLSAPRKRSQSAGSIPRPSAAALTGQYRPKAGRGRALPSAPLDNMRTLYQQQHHEIQSSPQLPKVRRPTLGKEVSLEAEDVDMVLENERNQDWEIEMDTGVAADELAGDDPFAGGDSWVSPLSENTPAGEAVAANRTSMLADMVSEIHHERRSQSQNDDPTSSEIDFDLNNEFAELEDSLMDVMDLI